MSAKRRLRIGAKKSARSRRKFSSNFVQPAGKFWKRNAAKASRKSDIPSGKGGYKRVWGWFVWGG